MLGINRKIMGCITDKIEIVILIVVFFSTVNISLAQEAKIVGTVIDSTTSETLPGVNVGIQNLGKGAATNADGKFEITGVPEGTHTITASFVGFESNRRTVEISAGKTVELSLSLVPQTYVGDEVVVTALGVERSEKSVGYAVQEVGGEQVSGSPEIGVVNSLAGKTAGVQITSSSGQPGSASRIVIRGANSITGNNQPLFVIDGVPISNAENGAPGVGALNGGSGSSRALDIDPSIIENLTVLKGGSATALYGSRASNGVVMITTKTGQQGGMQVDFNSKLRLERAIIDGTQEEYLSGEQGYFANGLPVNRGGYMEPGYPGSNPETSGSWGPHKNNVSQQVLTDLGVDRIETYNHLQNFYQLGTSAENSLTFSGGDENGMYFLSGSRLDQIGTVPTSSLNRTNLNAKVTRELFTDKLESETRVNYINTINKWKRNGYASSARITRLWPINLKMKPYEYDDGTNRTLGGGTDSPYWFLNETGFESSIDRLMLTERLTYDITPWLALTNRFGLDKYTDSRQQHRNQRVRYENDGSMYEDKIVDSEINNDLMLDMQEVQITESFGVSGLLGNNINVQSYSDVSVTGSGQNIPDFFDDSNFNDIDGSQYKSRRRLVGLYGQAVLNYEDYIFLTLTARNDWSSTLPKDNRSYFYPSASLGFIFTDMFNGLTENTPLSYGKIRASISQTGSAAPVYSLSTAYNSAGFTNWIEGTSTSLDFPYNGMSGFSQSGTLGNPNLKPEMTTSNEVGLNLSFFNGRASIDGSYYSNTTSDQIYSTPVSSGTGFTNMLRNAGKIKNSGFELTVSGSPIETQDFQWNLSANWSKNKSEVVSLAPGVQRVFLAGYAWPSVQAQEDEGYGIIRGYGYERNENGQLIINDDSNSARYGYPVQADEQLTLGNIQPDWLGNLRSTFRFKGFTLSGLLDIRQGGDILNFSRNYTIGTGMAEITEQRGTQMTNSNQPGYIEPYVWEGVKQTNGEPNDIELLRDQNFWDRYGSIHENQVEDGSYIKLREVSLSYRLPTTFLENTPLRTASFTVTGRNLWIKSDFSYGDPEGNIFGTDNGGQGFYYFITPTSRSIMFNLKLGL